jgi:hypothetical protein
VDDVDKEENDDKDERGGRHGRRVAEAMMDVFKRQGDALGWVRDGCVLVLVLVLVVSLKKISQRVSPRPLLLQLLSSIFVRHEQLKRGDLSPAPRHAVRVFVVGVGASDTRVMPIAIAVLGGIVLARCVGLGPFPVFPLLALPTLMHHRPLLSTA